MYKSDTENLRVSSCLLIPPMENIFIMLVRRDCLLYSCMVLSLFQAFIRAKFFFGRHVILMEELWRVVR